MFKSVLVSVLKTYTGLSQSLCAFWTPPPHVLEQADHSLHSAQPPSTLSGWCPTTTHSPSKHHCQRQDSMKATLTVILIFLTLRTSLMAGCPLSGHKTKVNHMEINQNQDNSPHPHGPNLSSLLLIKLTLSSPQLVPSTAPSSFEWQVVPTVHHRVLHTLCRSGNSHSVIAVNCFHTFYF